MKLKNLDSVNIVYLIPSWKLTYFPYQGLFKDVFPFPQVGYVISLEGMHGKKSAVDFFPFFWGVKVGEI